MDFLNFPYTWQSYLADCLVSHVRFDETGGKFNESGGCGNLTLLSLVTDASIATCRYRRRVFDHMKPDAENLSKPGNVLPPAGAERERLFWTLQIAGWSAVGSLSIYPLLQLFSWPVIGVILVMRVGSGILVTTAIRQFLRRIPWRRWSWWRLSAGVLIICVVLGAVDSLGTHSLAKKTLEWAGRSETTPTEVHGFVLLAGVLLRSSLFIIWTLLYFGIKLWLEAAETRLDAARREAAVRTAELRQLRAQVHPHFLFNALNSILAEKDNPDAVEKITQELAEYLRFSLRPADDCQALGDELDALEHYLRVEKARFEEKLVYAIEAPPEARRVRVPVAMIQPLLENAMKYGRLTSGTPLQVRISAALSRPARALEVTVQNSGRWLEFDAARSHGIGLSNLRRRLELLFGTGARLTHQADCGWVQVAVTLPVAVLPDEMNILPAEVTN